MDCVKQAQLQRAKSGAVVLKLFKQCQEQFHNTTETVKVKKKIQYTLRYSITEWLNRFYIFYLNYFMFIYEAAY